MQSRTLNALVALSLAAPALGQRAAAVEASEVVLVAASRSQTSVADMPLHTTVLGRAQIDSAPAQSLDQLLRGVAGLNFSGVPAAQSDPTGQQTRMRGMGNAKVLVLLDGVPIHDPFYLTTQWFKVPLSNIERVEVVRGGISSLWGNMATAGVVNIVSRRAADDAGEFSASRGSYGSSNLALSKDFAASAALSFNLAIDRFHTAGYQTTPAAYLWRFPAKRPVDATNSNVQLTAHFQPAPALTGQLRLGYHVQDQEISYRYGRNLQDSPDLSASLSKELDQRSSVTANAWAQNVTFEKYNGASCYWQATGTRCPTSSTVTTDNINGDIVQYYSQYGSQRYSERGGALTYSITPGGGWSSFQVGLDRRKLAADDLEYFYSAPAVASAPQNVNSSTHGVGEQRFDGLFSQTKLSPSDELELSLSGRYDAWRNSRRSNTRTTAAGLTTGGAVAAASASAFDPSLAARYELSASWSLRAAAYKAFRAPGFNNITRTYGSGSATTIANPDLGPENLKGWELGADHRGDVLSLGATYFHYDIKNMIATYTVKATQANIPAQVTTICGAVVAGGFSNCGGATTTSVSFYTNDQDGQAHGLELSGRWRLRDMLTVDASLSHTETYLTRRGAVVTDPLGVQLAAVPKNVAALGATWKPDQALRAYAELRYIGPLAVDTTSVAGTSFGQGGVTLFNLSTNYAWDRSSELFASAVNLFDKQYSENNYKYNQAYNRTLSQPRTITLGVKLRW